MNCAVVMACAWFVVIDTSWSVASAEMLLVLSEAKSLVSKAAI